MADQLIVSAVRKQLDSILLREEDERIRLIKGVNREVQKFRSNILAVQGVLEDAESRLLVTQECGADDVEDWLLKVRNTFYGIDDALDEWNAATQKLQMKEFDYQNVSKPLRKVCHSYIIPSYRLIVLQGDLAIKLKDLYRKLDVIAKEKEKFNFKTMEVIKEPEPTMNIPVKLRELVYERDGDRQKILDLILNESSQGPTTLIICMVGPEGIGKTTLAREVFNCEKVNSHFDKKIWVSAYNIHDEIRIAKAILQSLKNDASNPVELEMIMQHMRQYIKGKKFLLALDDVEPKYLKNWKQLNYSLKYGSRGSRILVTTQQENDVREIGISTIIPLGPLSEEDSLLLLSEFALFEQSLAANKKMEEIGGDLVKKCNRLPLAIKILGNLLRFKKNIEEWDNILHNDVWELQNDEGFLPPLLLSYYDFPSVLRKCFSYCAIFPKNYEIEKNHLIKLWMSQNYLNVEGREDMELIGEKYFDMLAMRSFFQDFQENEYSGSIKSCKMHDIVHNFAQFIAKNEVSIMEANGSEENSISELKHLMVLFEREGSFPINAYSEARKLRSLLVEPKGGFMSEVDLSKLFEQLTCLRALDLSNQDNAWFKLIEEVPRGIKKLTHLRYLNLSRNQKIKELPETMCELYNLQTLELSWCTNLKSLPKGMGKLINLRHLAICGTSVSYMPKGIERLTSLRTLNEFVVSQRNDGSKACALGCLGNFSHLQSLSIKKLGNVTEEKEVGVAKLSNKRYLRDLYLNFQKDEEKATIDKHYENILSSLQLPPNLWRFEMSYYRGKSFFTNAMLTEVRLMSLEHCKNLEDLPPLGGLIFLESLIIRCMKRVERVGNQFLGKTRLSPITTAFPRLKYLEFWNMNKWKDWSIEKKKEEDITIMPYLSSLIIGVCPELENLPDYILQKDLKIKIISCSKLEEKYGKRTEDNRQNIANIKFYPEY